MSGSTVEIVGPGEVLVGERTSVADGVQFIFHRPAKLVIGDYCTIGPGVKFVIDGGDVEVGDWTTLHDRCLVLSGQGVRIGQNCWFGQNCVLDGTGGLTVGNGVRVGMYSQIWSHVAAGEQIEGCTLFGTRPVIIEDDVWLVGSCIVASGVTIGRRSVALIASNITKSWPEESTLAGSPASLKENLNFYRPIDISEKWVLLEGWLSKACSDLGLIRVPHERALIYRWMDQSNEDSIVFLKTEQDESLISPVGLRTTVCFLSSKFYRKRLTDIEHSVLKYLAGNKARFKSIN